MKRSFLAAMVMVALTAPAAHGQAKLLPPRALPSDETMNTVEPPQMPSFRPGQATLGPPTSLPLPSPPPSFVPSNGPPHQMKGREPAHGTKTAGVPDVIAPKAALTPMAMPAPEICGPLGRFWVTLDGLVWWVQGDKPPALVTTSPGGTSQKQAGVLLAPGTAVLFGGREFNDDAQPGFRLNTGYWFDALQTFGIQAGGFWLDNKNASASFASDGSTILARPFVDATTGKQSAELIAFPGVSSGSVIVTGHSSFDGWDVALRQLACCSCCNGRVDAVLGFRQLRLADQLAIGQETTVLGAGGPGGLPAGTQLVAVDHFDTVNEFYGAEFGFEAEYRYHGWVVEGLVKLAAGWNVSHVNINGASFTTLPGQATSTSTGGLLALPSNIGVYRHTDLTLIPEFGINVAYDLTQHLRLRGGYSFIYWDHVERPSQQIDPGINPSLIPPGAGGGPPRPQYSVAGTDMLVHGIIFGIEYRY